MSVEESRSQPATSLTLTLSRGTGRGDRSRPGVPGSPFAFAVTVHPLRFTPGVPISPIYGARHAPRATSSQGIHARDLQDEDSDAGPGPPHPVHPRLPRARRDRPRRPRQGPAASGRCGRARSSPSRARSATSCSSSSRASSRCTSGRSSSTSRRSSAGSARATTSARSRCSAGGPRTTSVRAMTDGRIAALHQVALEDVMRRSPSLALALCKGMAAYVRQILSRDTGIAFIDLDDIMIDPSAAALIPPKISASTRRRSPTRRDGDTVQVAMVDPYDAPTRTFLKEVLRGHTVEFAATSQSDFERYKAVAPQGSRRAAGARQRDGRDELPLGHRAEGRLRRHGDGRADGARVQAARSSTAPATCTSSRSASGRACGMRIDGNMVPIEDAVSAKLFNQVISRLKVMSDMDITNRRLPQDGRFNAQGGQPRAGDARVRSCRARAARRPCSARSTPPARR